MSDANRAVVNLVPDDGESRRMRTIQVTVFEGDVRDDVEHFEPYGITSRVQDAPADGRGAEAIVIDLGGCSDHPVAIVVGDRRYRIRGLKKGEVCIYDDQGQKVHLTRTGIVVDGKGFRVVPAATFDAGVDIGGTCKAAGFEVGLAAGADGPVTVVNGMVLNFAKGIFTGVPPAPEG